MRVGSSAGGHVILRKLWLRHRRKDGRAWSLRSVARQAKISPAFLSRVFSGKRALTNNLALKLLKVLRADDVTIGIVTPSAQLEPPVQKNKRLRLPAIAEYELSAEESEWVLGKWYRLCLIDLMTTSDFSSDPKWMAARLGLSLEEVLRSLAYLKSSGLAHLDATGVWKKTHSKLRFPTSTTRAVIRDHHRAHLKRAIAELENRVTPKDFKQRLITSLSVACNPAKFEAVKEYLHLALYEAAQMLSEDPCAEVYQLNLQLFSTTKRKKAKVP